MKQNNFCRYISNSLYLQIRSGGTLTAAPCCHFLNDYSVVLSAADIAAYQQRVNDISSFDDGHCGKCLLREQHGYRESQRQASFTKISDTDGTDLINLELQIDNSCNAACIMCSEAFSSQWKTLNSKLTGIPVVSDHATAKDYVDYVIKDLDLSKLRYLNIVGGEPFYTSTHLDVLKLIPNPENVSVQYVTNNSIFPDEETLAIWKKFKKIFVVVSLDDIGERYEYIRWPLKWHQIDKNFKKFLALSDVPLTMAINCTLNPLSVWYHDELVDYVADLFQVSDPYATQHLRIDYASFSNVDLDKCPEALRDAVYQKFGEHHKVSKMLSAMALHPSDPMIAWLGQQETLRNCKPWAQVFPEVARYFKT